MCSPLKRVKFSVYERTDLGRYFSATKDKKSMNSTLIYCLSLSYERTCANLNCNACGFRTHVYSFTVISPIVYIIIVFLSPLIF